MVCLILGKTYVSGKIIGVLALYRSQKLYKGEVVHFTLKYIYLVYANHYDCLTQIILKYVFVLTIILSQYEGVNRAKTENIKEIPWGGGDPWRIQICKFNPSLQHWLETKCQGERHFGWKINCLTMKIDLNKLSHRKGFGCYKLVNTFKCAHIQELRIKVKLTLDSGPQLTGSSIYQWRTYLKKSNIKNTY